MKYYHILEVEYRKKNTFQSKIYYIVWKLTIENITNSKQSNMCKNTCHFPLLFSGSVRTQTFYSVNVFYCILRRNNNTVDFKTLPCDTCKLYGIWGINSLTRDSKINLNINRINKTIKVNVLRNLSRRVAAGGTGTQNELSFLIRIIMVSFII